ncbi:MAG: GspH/FimT family pseudopilin [Candidatus Rokubacteria bacterium]|nr:GspH/FimT family pseudopilin [Candidatus Rokubacteria bacterium]
MGSREEVGARGFTLLELLVTLSVIALAVGLALPAIGRSTETVRARAEVAGFSAVLRHARELAITRRLPHRVVVEPDARRVTVVGGDDEVRRTRVLSERLTIEAVAAPSLTVRFEPEGSSSGGEFRLTSGTTAYRVTVDAVTGRVRATRE